MKGWKMAALAAALVVAVAAGAALTPPMEARTQTKKAIAPPRTVEILTGGSRIGISIRDLEEADAKGKPAAASGVLVEDVVAGSPAEKAGMRTGDVIVEFDGERVRSARQLTRLVQETPAGRNVIAAVVRDGQRSNLTVTPMEGARWSFDNLSELQDLARGFRYKVAPPRPPSAPDHPVPPSPPAVWKFDELLGRSSRLGATVDSLSPQLAEYFGTKRGVLVTSVYDDSAAASAGLKAGDVITSLNGAAVEDPSDVRRRAQALNDGEEFTIEVMRDRKPLTLKGKVARTEGRRTSRTIL
jgi:S1-C subfamily serine protease